MPRLVIVLSLLSSGCYLAHGLDGPPPIGRDAGPGFDAVVPPGADAGSDAFVPLFDAGRRDAGFDAGPDFDGGCELPVTPFPERDVCRESTGECITDCGDVQICIISCLQRDDVCRRCAVRNALACFNDTPCVRHYPAVSCCIVGNCGASEIDDVLNVCTAIACETEFQRYADCAIGRARLECRMAVAECGLPPNLLGLD